MSRFWDWALKAYARPGVAQSCLALQDDHGQCTPYLLWAAWAAQDGVGLDEAALMHGADLARRWEPAFITPVRAVRRALKPAFRGVADESREALRDQVKAVELAAEQTLMLALEAIASATPSSGTSVSAALDQASALWAPSAPKAALAALSQRL